MKAKISFWSFFCLCVQISYVSAYYYGNADVPEALEYDNDWWNNEDCQDGMCVDETMYVDFETTKQIPGSDIIMVDDYNFMEVNTRSVWKSCLPNAPANMISKSFKDCDNVTVSKKDEENLELSCQFHKRGLISSTGELDQVKVMEVFSPLPTTKELMQGCIDWVVDSDDYKSLMYHFNYEVNGYDYYDYYNYYYDYDYDRSNKKASKTTAEKKSKKSGGIMKVLKNAKNDLTKSSKKKGANYNKSAKGKKKRQNKKRVKGKKKKQNKKRVKGKKKKLNKKGKGKKKGKQNNGQQGKSRQKRSKGKNANTKGKGKAKGKGKDKGKDKENTKALKKKMKKQLKQIGLTSQPTIGTLAKAYCIHAAVEKGLEKCAVDTIQTNGVPEGFSDY